jgi:hypothetical protein
MPPDAALGPIGEVARQHGINGLAPLGRDWYFRRWQRFQQAPHMHLQDKSGLGFPHPTTSEIHSYDSMFPQRSSLPLLTIPFSRISKRPSMIK